MYVFFGKCLSSLLLIFYWVYFLILRFEGVCIFWSQVFLSCVFFRYCLPVHSLSFYFRSGLSKINCFKVWSPIYPLFFLLTFRSDHFELILGMWGKAWGFCCCLAYGWPIISTPFAKKTVLHWIAIALFSKINWPHTCDSVSWCSFH